MVREGEPSHNVFKNSDGNVFWRAARSTFITESSEGNLLVTEVIYIYAYM